MIYQAISKIFLGTKFSFAVLMMVSANAGEVKIINATATQQVNDTWSISVTLQHDDAGWDHYANRWDVLDTDGNLLGSRMLLHPHINEQPFTRSLDSIEIPKSLTEVTIQANDSLHGINNTDFILKLERK